MNGTNRKHGDSKIFLVASVRNLTFVKTLSCMGKEEVAMAPIFLWWTLLVLA